MRNQTSDLWISSVGRELNQYSRGHGFKCCTGQNFFYTLFSLLVNSVNYYENRFHFYFFNFSKQNSCKKTRVFLFIPSFTQEVYHLVPVF